MARREILNQPRHMTTRPPRRTDTEILEQLPGTTGDLARVLGYSEAGMYQRLRRLETEGRATRYRREGRKPVWSVMHGGLYFDYPGDD